MIYNERQKEKSMDMREFPLDELSRRCAEETKNFLRHVPHDTEYCYELFRRALAEKDSEALDQIYLNYLPQMRRWVSNHSRFPISGEIDEYFAHHAFQQFFFALLGEKFNNFPNLSSVLAYLKSCVHTTVTQYVRDNRIPPLLLDDMDIPVISDLNADIEAEWLWKHICNLLIDANDQLLAQCVFVLEMRPREVAKQYPRIWVDAHQVSVRLHQIRRTLAKDPRLRNRLNGDSEDS
ncbi:MAG: hypothetical protein K8L97_23190 [Anaerolineae bacterium]|nr:hypothetical protein [Anaerolineae bacterium]